MECLVYLKTKARIEKGALNGYNSKVMIGLYGLHYPIAVAEGASQSVRVTADIRVFPKTDHSARADRILLVEYTIGSVVELKFC